MVMTIKVTSLSSHWLAGFTWACITWQSEFGSLRITRACTKYTTRTLAPRPRDKERPMPIGSERCPGSSEVSVEVDGRSYYLQKKRSLDRLTSGFHGACTVLRVDRNECEGQGKLHTHTLSHT